MRKAILTRRLFGYLRPVCLGRFGRMLVAWLECVFVKNATPVKGRRVGYLLSISLWFSAFALRLPALKALPPVIVLKIFSTISSSFVKGAPFVIMAAAWSFICCMVFIIAIFRCDWFACAVSMCKDKPFWIIFSNVFVFFLKNIFWIGFPCIFVHQFDLPISHQN